MKLLVIFSILLVTLAICGICGSIHYKRSIQFVKYTKFAHQFTGSVAGDDFFSMVGESMSKAAEWAKTAIDVAKDMAGGLMHSAKEMMRRGDGNKKS